MLRIFKIFGFIASRELLFIIILGLLSATSFIMYEKDYIIEGLKMVLYPAFEFVTKNFVVNKIKRTLLHLLKNTIIYFGYYGYILSRLWSHCRVISIIGFIVFVLLIV